MTSNSLTGHRFRSGDRVRVKSRDAILATLDERGETRGMPFMPEMLRLCGKSFTVSKRADKTCDTIQYTGLRQMTDTVHLDDLRCDGSAHGGCQNNCLLFWREEWLVNDPADEPSAITSTPPDKEGHNAPTVETLHSATTIHADEDRPADAIRYSCQATRLRSASQPLSALDPRQYVRDITSGNTNLRRVFLGLLITLFNKYQDVSCRFPSRLRFRDGMRYPFIAGSLTRTPREELGLSEGELVQIKSKEEIVATLDSSNRNRGLTFDAEMVKYCGRYARVKERVDHVIDENTGHMIYMQNACVTLENVVCDADFHRFCPRAIYPFWREIWLRRVPEDTVHRST